MCLFLPNSQVSCIYICSLPDLKSVYCPLYIYIYKTKCMECTNTIYTHTHIYIYVCVYIVFVHSMHFVLLFQGFDWLDGGWSD